MKPKEFADALRKARPLLGSREAMQLGILADMLASSPSATVAATVKKLGNATLAPATGSVTIGDVLRALVPLQDFMDLYGKPAVAKDLQTLTAFLQRFSQAGVGPFVDKAVAALNPPAAPPPPALREEVVQRHLRRLEQTLGNDAAFRAAYDELEHDPDLGKLEIAALAKRFTDTAPKSRSAALKKIWARHHSLMTFEAKSQSRDGRSAA